MVYADSESSQKNYDKYYEQFSKYEDTKTASGGGYTPSDRSRLDEMASVLAEHLKPSDSILDIGCVNGGLLEALSCRGFTNLTGIDPSLVSIEHIQQRGFKGYASIISELNKDKVGKYKAIIISHVLEHIFDVTSTMEIMKSLLDEDGLLYIEVPDALHYFHHYVVPFYYFDPEHINHFDYHALINLADLHGFEVISWSEKTIRISDNIDYPAIYAIFKKHPTGNPYRIELSFDLKSSVLNFIEQSKQDNKIKKIEYYANNGNPIILWGAGSYTQRLMASTRLLECNIVAIVDSDKNKQGLYLHSIPIQYPDIVHNLEGTIIISAALYAEEIKRDISAMGLKNTVAILC